MAVTIPSRLFVLEGVMPTITALEVQKRNKRRINLYLDDAFAFGLAMNAAVALRVDQLLSASDVETLQAADDLERAYERALRFLSYRPRSEEEIRHNLQKHKVADVVIATALERLRAAKYVNDTEFATLWVDNRAEHRPRGRRALRYELRQKGISDAIIEASLDEVDELAAARTVAWKKVGRFAALPQREFRQKMYGLLARRGFDSETIRTVIQELIEEHDLTDSEFENED